MSTVASVTAEAPAARDRLALVDEGRRVLRAEAKAVDALAGRLGESFARAAQLVAASRETIVLAGVGKSGLVARKVAATMTSTGTAATFLHPVDALHGDLGIIARGAVVLVFSRSGATTELLGLLASDAARRTTLVALVGDLDSPLARRADVVLDCAVSGEACALGLSPTTSTTAALAMGDALAVAVARLRGFGANDFARLHPGGALGQHLSVRVRDAMIAADYPAVTASATVREVILPLARMRGTVPVIDAGGALAGVVTAGDLARLMEREADFLDLPVSAFMTTSPRIAFPGESGIAAIRRMERHGVMALPVLDGRILAGIVHLHDLLRAGALHPEGTSG